MAAGNERFGCSNPSCPGDCCTSWLAQSRTLSATFTWHEPGFEPTTWRPFSPVGSPLEHSRDAPKVAQTTCAVALTRGLLLQRG